MHEFGGICKESRQRVKMTKEQAASLLYISDSSISRYESGETVPTPTTVMNMTRHYDDPFLTLNYCKSCCPIGASFSFEVDQNIDFSTAVLGFADAQEEVDNDISSLIKVAAEFYKFDEDIRKEIMCNFFRKALRLAHYLEIIEVIASTMGIDTRKLRKEYNKEYELKKRKRPSQMAV